MDPDDAPPPVLVIGGGGLGGIAWALGVLVGLDDACPPPDHWACVVGTSAGSAVGANLLAGRLATAYGAQYRDGDEIHVDVDLAAHLRRILDLVDGIENAAQARARIGAFAIDAVTVPAERRRNAVAARLGDATWPDGGRLVVTAVDAVTGRLVTMSDDTGVGLVDAVTASCAVPGIWPVVEVAGRRLMDGGVRSICNADLGPADGRRVVLVPSPLDDRAQRRLERELDGFEAVVVTLDDASIAAIGDNPLDPGCRAAAADAGRRQGQHELRRIADHLRAASPPPTR